MNRNSDIIRRNFFQRRIPVYRKDPVLFVKEVLRFEPDEWQANALQDLAKSSKVAIKSLINSFVCYGILCIFICLFILSIEIIMQIIKNIFKCFTISL